METLTPPPETTPVVTATTTVFQGFRVGPFNFLTHFEHASELTELPTLYRLPRTATSLLGLVNRHGRLVPVFDLAIALQCQPSSTASRMLLVIGHDEAAAGVLIDGLPQRLRFSAQDHTAHPTLADPFKQCVIAYYREATTCWIELDFSQLFLSLTHNEALSA